MVNEISKTLGMNVTLKPAPDSYELLSTGVMDGTLFPAESTESFKIDKIIKHATTFPGGLYNTSFVVHDEPGALRQAQRRREEGDRRHLGRTGCTHLRPGLGQGRPARHRELMQANGVQITKADAKFVAASRPRPRQARSQVGQPTPKAAGLKNASQGAGRVPRRDRQAGKIAVRRRRSPVPERRPERPACAMGPLFFHGILATASFP
jgi:hypothetical protein